MKRTTIYIEDNVRLYAYKRGMSLKTYINGLIRIDMEKEEAGKMCQCYFCKDMTAVPGNTPMDPWICKASGCGREQPKEYVTG